LLNVKDLAPGILVEMRYASTNNFTGQVLYPAAECLLCEPAARRLAAVQQKLENRGLGLKVWDCYRPLSVQKKLWDIVPDPRYVADPKTGSRHNRGASVDLTLVDARGRELPMPTAFDEFSEKAHRSYSELSAKVRRNRQILQEAMEAEGFVGLPTEWWHFDDPSWSQFALRDEPLGSPSLRKDQPAQKAAAFIGGDVRQLVVVTSAEWGAPTGRLQRWQRAGGGWRRVGEPWPVSLGKKGMAWGRGRQPVEAGTPGKAEGDLTAPAGIFPLGSSYGYAAQAPEGVRWPYQALGERWVCVDDPDSKRYNAIFEAGLDVRKDWRSAETMRRKDHLYKWLINVEQNSPPECGCGSCIFLHVWRRPGAPTEGCTAMEENNIIDLLRWLDPAARPVLVQLPDDVYARMRDAWDLP
jgi:zinc D-Ala-D-Ala dipeptidase